MRSSAFLLLIGFLSGCGGDGFHKTAYVRNDLQIARKEVISFDLNDVTSDTVLYRKLVVKDGDSTLITQLFDSNDDSIFDELLVYLSIGPGEEKKLLISTSGPQHDQVNTYVFSRFAPERIDDYAWENDLVAFRMYGPEAQRLTDEGLAGGTLSSGIDCWLKRVDYPVINKWYAKYVGGGTYHKDDGEGYDPYHVGSSRGCGGIGVWRGDTMFVSKNFISWKKIANGPLRNVFELSYAPWDAGGVMIRETKRISIDAGSQLAMVEELIETTDKLPHMTIGVTLHDAKGQIVVDSARGVFGYWEQIDDGYLGTGVVVPSENILSYVDHRSAKKDMSHLFVNIKAGDRVRYYTGFGWSKADKITSFDKWKSYLSEFSQRRGSPLQVFVK